MRKDTNKLTSSDDVVKRELELPNSDSCHYVILHETLITSLELTGEELRLLVFLMCYDLPDHRNSGKRKGYVFLSRKRIGERLNKEPRQISYLLASLQSKGFIERKLQKGKASRIYFLEKEPLQKICNTTLAENLQGSTEVLHKSNKGPLQKICNHKNRKEEKNLKKSTASSTRNPSKTSKQATKPKETDPRIKILIDFFSEKHTEIHGERPHIMGGKDASAIKRLLNTIPDVEQLKVRMNRYLNDQLGWMDRPLWNITGFEKQVNAYGNDKSQQPEPISNPAYRKFD